MEHCVNNLTASQKGKKIMHSFSHSLIKSINYRSLQGALDAIYSMKRNGFQIRKLISTCSVELLTTDIVTERFLDPEMNNQQPLSLCDLSRNCKT